MEEKIFANIFVKLVICSLNQEIFTENNMASTVLRAYSGAKQSPAFIKLLV